MSVERKITIGASLHRRSKFQQAIDLLAAYVHLEELDLEMSSSAELALKVTDSRECVDSGAFKHMIRRSKAGFMPFIR